jgi:HlyD family secretion protein
MPEGDRKPLRLDAVKPAPPPLARLDAPRRHWLWIGAGLLIVLAAAAAYWWFSAADAPVRYVTQQVTRGNVQRSITASGTVNPVTTIQVGSYVSGVIRDVNCDFNTNVKAGELCAKIDPRPFQSAVDQAAANLQSAKAQLAKDQATMVYQRGLAERNARLVERGIVSQDAADSSKAAYEAARAAIALDQATIQQRQAALDAAQINLDYTNIISPVDGTVVSRNVTVGQTVASSLQSPTLFLIATDLTKMQVDANVSESDIGPVKEGNRATFTVQGFPNNTFDGVVAQVRQAPITLQNVVTYDVVINFDNPQLLLKPGMTATAKIFTAERHDVLRVPEQALHFTPSAVGGGQTPATQPQQRPQQGGGFGPGGAFGPGGGNPQAAAQSRARRAQATAQSRVWVLRDGEPVAVQVQIGLNDDAFAEVVGGDLKEGDQIIVTERREGSNRGGGNANTGPRMPRF